MPHLPGNDLNLGTAIGRDANLIFPRQLRSTHLYVCGATGTGKSKFLEHLIRQDIKNWHKSKCGLLLLDPHGSLFDGLMEWLSWNDRILNVPVVPIDLRQEDWAVAYNVLRRRHRADPAVIISNFVQAMAYVWGESGTERTPLFARWATNILRTLYEKEFTLVESQHLINQTNKRLRQAMVEGITNQTAIRDWALADTLSPLQFETFVGSTINRLHPFLETETLRLMFGQVTDSLDLGKAIEEGQIILVSLATRYNRVSEEDAALFATLLLSDLWASAKDRDKSDRLKPFYCYIDEFQNFVTPTIAKNLDQARGFGLHLTLAHQFPQQLMHAGAHGKEVYDSILVNARSKVVFGLSGEENLRPLAQELFMGTMDPNRIKHELYSTKVMDYSEETRTVQGRSTSSGRGSTEHTGWAAGLGMGGTENYIYPVEEQEEPQSASESTSQFESRSSSQLSSESYAESESTTEVPFLSPIMGKELSSVQFEPVEEQLFRAMAALHDQEQRQCVVRLVGMKAPLSIYTPTMAKMPATAERTKRFLDRSYEKLPFALPRATAKVQLAQRTENFAKAVFAEANEEPTTTKRRVLKGKAKPDEDASPAG